MRYLIVEVFGGTHLHDNYLEMNGIVLECILLSALLCQSEELFDHGPEYASHELNLALRIDLAKVLQLLYEKLKGHHENILHLGSCIFVSKELVHI